LDPFTIRKRYQRGRTARYGQIEPLTVVNGPKNGARRIPAGSVTILWSSRPVSCPEASVSRFRSQISSGISYRPDGRSRAASSSSRIR
jgi:hypothetical protein